MFYNRYPYTDYSQLNLDWFLGQFKELTDAWDAQKVDYEQFKLDVTTEFNTLSGKFDNLKETVETFTTFVENYFENLDVQTEINNKLDQMVADGTMEELLTPLVNTKVPESVTAWLTANVDPVGSAVVVDSSLSIAGAAADAKVTGDAIEEIHEELNVTDKSINVSSDLTETLFREVKIFDTGSYYNDTDFTTYSFDVSKSKHVRIKTLLPEIENYDILYYAFYNRKASDLPSPGSGSAYFLGGSNVIVIGTPAGVQSSFVVDVPEGALSLLVSFDSAYISDLSDYLKVENIVTINDRTTILESEVDKINDTLYTVEYSTTIPTTAGSAVNTTSIGHNDALSIHANIPQGTTCVMKMDTDLVNMMGIYVLYDGGNDYTTLTTAFYPYQDYTFIAANDIVAIGFYRTGSGVLGTGDLTIKCEIPDSSYILNPFVGKKILMFGDSITQLPFTGNTTGNGIVEWFAKLTGADVIRAGIGGTHLARTEVPTVISDMDDANAALEICSMVEAMVDGDLTLQVAAAQYKSDHGGVDTFIKNTLLPSLADVVMDEIDIITIFGGTNDCGAGFPLDNGDDDTLDTSCVRGAINYMVKKICTAYPHIKVYFFTPIIRQFTEGDNDTWSDIYAPHGILLPQYAEEIEDASKSNHIPVCDLYYGMGWNKYNFGAFCLPTDMTHPRKGFRELAEKMIAFIESHL